MSITLYVVGAVLVFVFSGFLAMGVILSPLGARLTASFDHCLHQARVR